MEPLTTESEILPEPPTPVEDPGPVLNWQDILLITLGSVVILLTGFGILIALLRLLQAQGQDNNTLTIYSSLGASVLEAVALIGAIFWLGIRRRRLSWQSLGLRPLKPFWQRAAILLGLALIPTAGLIALAVRYLMGAPLESPQLPFIAPGGFSWLGLIGMFVLVGLVVPFAEELYFRGLIFPWIAGRWGATVGILLSALIFGVVHVEPSVAVAAFAMGLLFAWVNHHSGSLWTSIIIHAINNSLQVLLVYIALVAKP